MPVQVGSTPKLRVFLEIKNNYKKQLNDEVSMVWSSLSKTKFHGLHAPPGEMEGIRADLKSWLCSGSEKAVTVVLQLQMFVWVKISLSHPRTNSMRVKVTK